MKLEAETVYGMHALESALRHQPERVLEVWVDTRRHDDKINNIISLAKKAGITVNRLPRHVLDERFADKRHQGVVARISPGQAGTEQDLDSILGNESRPFILVLDGVQDPHNLGACLRSADAAGVNAVVVPRDRAAGLTATVRKVACGAAEHIPLIQVTNLARTLRQLKERGLWLIGLAGEGDQSIYECDLNGPIAIVMGAEGEGLRHLTKEHCDFLVRIPMSGSVESLNVSVATGISLFEAVRQRQGLLLS